MVHYIYVTFVLFIKVRLSMKKIQLCDEQKIVYKRVLIAALFLNIFMAVYIYIAGINSKIPDNILLIENREEKFDFGVPIEGEMETSVDAISINNSKGLAGKNIHFNLKNSVIMKGSTAGSYKAELKLFGLFHYKDVRFNVIKEQKIMPSGRAVGLYVNSSGVMVLGSSEVTGKDGTSYEPAANILQTGDYIYSIDDKRVESIDDIVHVLQQYGSGKVKVKLRRGKNMINVKVESILANDGTYKIGAWLREDTEGIGTVTYINKDNKYAALGHGITDIDSGLLIDIKDGGVYPASVERIVPGEAGIPGEIIGSVKLGDTAKIGTIDYNTDHGIVGTLNSKEYLYNEKSALPIGLKQEVKEGAAQIRCQIGKSVKNYDVEIEKVYLNSQDNKGMVVRVTDKELLKKTGGIIQGMSGSPIIQKGKIIGAVTHVFVNDATRGYGIFIEEML